MLLGMGMAVDLSGALALPIVLPVPAENHFQHDFAQVGRDMVVAMNVVSKELPTAARQALEQTAQLELAL
jgi:hypothetical protein